MNFHFCFFSAALVCCTALSACNSTPADKPTAKSDMVASDVSISGAWSRETAEGQDAGGAFMTITNTGTLADRLTGGSTSVAGEVRVHTVDMTDGVMRMRQLTDGLEIPARSSVTLKPGSFHIMLMQLKQPLRQGETVPVTLTFEQAGSVEIELAVQPVGAEGPAVEAAGGDDG
jgi:periplasmic copper chaperone A